MGPLAGVKIVEMAGIGPGPMCSMLLSDLGATVLRVDRREPSGLGVQKPTRYDLLLRGRKLLAVDLKDPRAIELVLELVADADALLEPFRPGVMERLGLGPDICAQRNPRLVYARMTGWGQTGPLAPTVGHDLNYIALSGALASFGRLGSAPTPPANIGADYIGALYLALGMVSAILEARGSGKGQVIDCAMIDCSAHIMTNCFGMLAAGLWKEQRGTNIIDGGAYFYDVYLCKDGRWLSVAPIEAKFYKEFVARLGLPEGSLPPPGDRERWPEGHKVLEAHFKTRTVAEWCALFEGSETCVAPVLQLSEALQHPHFRARGSFVEIDGIPQPAPQPLFSRTRCATPTAPATDRGRNPEDALSGWKLGAQRIAALREAGVVG